MVAFTHGLLQIPLVLKAGIFQVKLNGTPCSAWSKKDFRLVGLSGHQAAGEIIIKAWILLDSLRCLLVKGTSTTLNSVNETGVDSSMIGPNTVPRVVVHTSGVPRKNVTPRMTSGTVCAWTSIRCLRPLIAIDILIAATIAIGIMHIQSAA